MKKKIILIILAIVSLIIITIGIVIGTRYIQYKNIIGEYELVEDEGLKTLNLNLYKFISTKLFESNITEIKINERNCNYLTHSCPCDCEIIEDDKRNTLSNETGL